MLFSKDKAVDVDAHSSICSLKLIVDKINLFYVGFPPPLYFSIYCRIQEMEDQLKELLVDTTELIADFDPEEEGDEELYKDFSNMREFHVLDEIETTANDEEDGKDNRDSDSSSSYNEADSEADFDEIQEDEIDAMLEEGGSYPAVYLMIL